MANPNLLESAMPRPLLNTAMVALLLAAAPALAHSGADHVDRDRTHVRPSDAVRTLMVDNDVGRAVTVLADGRQVDVVSAGAFARVRIPGDTRRVEARVGARRIAMLSLDTMDRVWRLERPTETAVLVKNPLPVAVAVTLGGLTRTLGPGATSVFDDVAVGSSTFVARRTTGQLIDRDTVRLSAFDDFRWEVDPPETGLVQVKNRWSSPVEVLINGVLVDVLAPGETRTVDVQAGRAEVRLTRLSRSGRRGATVLEKSLRVDRYALSRIVTGPDSSRHAHREGVRPSAR